MLADKAEDLFADYFKKYVSFSVTSPKDGTHVLMKEMQNVANLYESHRLYVYRSCMVIFHRLFVEQDETKAQENAENESIEEDIFRKSKDIRQLSAGCDLIPHQSRVRNSGTGVLQSYKVYRQAEKFCEEVNDATTNLLTNYSTYTFPRSSLISKIERNIRLGTEADLYAEAETVLVDYEPDTTDIPKHVIATTYRALACYYAGKEEAAKLINNLLNEVSLEEIPVHPSEIKSLLGITPVCFWDYELFNQLANSIQRQIRMFGKDECENIQLFIKILKIAVSEGKRKNQENCGCYSKICWPESQLLRPHHAGWSLTSVESISLLNFKLPASQCFRAKAVCWG